MDKNNPTPEEIDEAVSSAEAAGIPIPCWAILRSPFGIQAIAAVQLGRNKGLIRDLNHCKELANDTGKLAAIVGNATAGVIAGRHAECACEDVFRPSDRGPDNPPGVCHGPNRV